MLDETPLGRGNDRVGEVLLLWLGGLWLELLEPENQLLLRLELLALLREELLELLRELLLEEEREGAT